MVLRLHIARTLRLHIARTLHFEPTTMVDAYNHNRWRWVAPASARTATGQAHRVQACRSGCSGRLASGVAVRPPGLGSSVRRRLARSWAGRLGGDGVIGRVVRLVPLGEPVLVVVELVAQDAEALVLGD